MGERVELRLPGHSRVLRVTAESADFWRSRGYLDAPAPEKKAAPRKRAAAKKKS